MVYVVSVIYDTPFHESPGHLQKQISTFKHTHTHTHTHTYTTPHTHTHMHIHIHIHTRTHCNNTSIVVMVLMETEEKKMINQLAEEKRRVYIFDDRCLIE